MKINNMNFPDDEQDETGSADWPEQLQSPRGSINVKEVSVEPNITIGDGNATVVAGSEVTVYVEAANIPAETTYDLTCYHDGNLSKQTEFSLYDAQNKFIGKSLFSQHQGVRGITTSQLQKKLHFKFAIENHASKGMIHCKLEQYNESYKGIYKSLNIEAVNDLTISMAYSLVTGKPGQIYRFAIMLNRLPNNNEALYFKFSNLIGEALDLIDLTNVQLATSGSSSGERVKLTNAAGAHNLANLKNTVLDLYVPVIAKEVTEFHRFLVEARVVGSYGVSEKSMGGILPNISSLTLSLPTTEVTGKKGETLLFPITLNRIPVEGDSLYFKLTDSLGQAVSSLDLNNIWLATSDFSEKVNLSNHAGAHALTNFSSTELKLHIPVINDVTAESKFTLQVNVGATENSSSAKQATGVIAVKEVFKVVGMQGVSRVEEAAVTGTLSGSPSESAGVTLYYRINLIGFTQEEQGVTRVTYRNSLDIRSQERQEVLTGFIHINQHEQWAPVFTIRVPGISNDKPVRVELSTSPSFEPSQTKETTVSVQKRPDADALVITSLSASVSATIGKMLAFKMTLNRIPNENESLYFKLTNSQGDALELLNLNDIRLIAPAIRVYEQVSLTDHAGAHNLSNLRSTSLRFRIPVIWETTEERALTLQVNVGATENSSSAKWAKGVILP